MKACSYYRTSTSSQVRRNTIDSQKNTVQRYAEANGIEIASEYADNGISGTTSDRPEYQKMLANLSNVDVILTFDVSRLFRDTELSQCYEFVNRCKAHGTRLICVQSGESYDFKDTEKVLAIMIRAIIAAMEHETLQARISSGISHARQKRGYWGRPKKPFDISKYFDLKERGFSQEEIARVMLISERTLRRKINQTTGNPVRQVIRHE